MGMEGTCGFDRSRLMSVNEMAGAKEAMDSSV